MASHGAMGEALVASFGYPEDSKVGDDAALVRVQPMALREYRPDWRVRTVTEDVFGGEVEGTAPAAARVYVKVAVVGAGAAAGGGREPRSPGRGDSTVRRVWRTHTRTVAASACVWDAPSFLLSVESGETVVVTLHDAALGGDERRNAVARGPLPPAGLPKGASLRTTATVALGGIQGRRCDCALACAVTAVAPPLPPPIYEERVACYERRSTTWYGGAGAWGVLGVAHEKRPGTRRDDDLLYGTDSPDALCPRDRAPGRRLVADWTLVDDFASSAGWSYGAEVESSDRSPAPRDGARVRVRLYARYSCDDAAVVEATATAIPPYSFYDNVVRCYGERSPSSEPPRPRPVPAADDDDGVGRLLAYITGAAEGRPAAAAAAQKGLGAFLDDAHRGVARADCGPRPPRRAEAATLTSRVACVAYGGSYVC